MAAANRTGTVAERAQPPNGGEKTPNGNPKNVVAENLDHSPSGRRSTPTIADVAALAEVSIATVSKALNGRPGVKVSTRARVLEAAEKLGFQSNALARSLLTGRSYTVGLITNDSYGRFTMPVLLGVEDTLQSGQLAVLLCDGRDDADSRATLCKDAARQASGWHHRDGAQKRPTGPHRPGPPGAGRLCDE